MQWSAQTGSFAGVLAWDYTQDARSSPTSPVSFTFKAKVLDFKLE
jgi:hypothetical protein